MSDRTHGGLEPLGALPGKGYPLMRRLTRQLLILRARASVPGLIASSDERSVISVVSGLNAGIAILIISVIAWLTDLPLLFPALGPSSFILFSQPFSRAAAPRNVILGHGSAIAVGLASWGIVSLVCQEDVTLAMGGWPPLMSASLALAMCCVMLVRMNCPHAPACASALIVALGGASSMMALLGMALGVAALTGQAILLGRIAGVNVPLWSSRESTLDPGL